MSYVKKIFIRVLEFWTGFWFSQVSPYPMALFRVLFGCYLLLYFLGSLTNISLFYSNAGVYCPVLIPDIAPSPTVALVLYAITVSLILALILGYRTRLISLLVLIFYFYHFCLNIWVRACSYDRLIIMALMVLCLAPSNEVLSVDALKKETRSAKTVSAWPSRLLAIHLCLFYLSTGIYKLLSNDWQSGEIVKGVMSSIFSSDIAFAVVGLNLPAFVFDILARSVIIFELICPIGFLIQDLKIKFAFSKKTFHIQGVQYYFFIAGIMFHAGIWIFMQIPQFFICPIFYVLFMPARDIKFMIRSIKKSYKLIRNFRMSWSPIQPAQGVLDNDSDS